MKLMIASDIHGCAPACKKLLDTFTASGADRLILLGDLLYHGPRNDLLDILLSVKPSGNGDVDEAVPPLHLSGFEFK